MYPFRIIMVYAPFSLNQHNVQVNFTRKAMITSAHDTIHYGRPVSQTLSDVRATTESSRVISPSLTIVRAAALINATSAVAGTASSMTRRDHERYVCIEAASARRLTIAAGVVHPVTCW